MKKILKTIFIIILIGGFALFLFWLINPGRAPIENNFITKVRNFSPFGNDDVTIDTDFENIGTNNVDNGVLSEDRELPNVEMVYSSPVGGYTLIDSGTTTMVRVVDRATGHIIDINPTTKQQTRISNTTLPGITEAIWFNDGKSVLMRYTREQSDVIETLLVSNLRTDGGETAGTYLEENILHIKPISNTEIAYVVPQGFGSKVNIYNVTDDSITNVLTSTIQGWRIIGSSKFGLYLQTKASYITPGYIYFLSKKDGSLTKIYSGVAGLNALISEDNASIFITGGGNNAYSLLLDQNYGSDRIVEVNTVADKCVYTENNSLYCGIPTQFPQNMPDDWYMGITSFTDQIWNIQTDGRTSFITNLQNTDAVKLETSSNEELFFVNKKNGTVWIVRLFQL